MCLAVTIQTVLTQYVLVGATTGQSLTAVGYAWVKGSCVALLTQGRASGGK